VHAVIVPAFRTDWQQSFAIRVAFELVAAIQPMDLASAHEFTRPFVALVICAGVASTQVFGVDGEGAGLGDGPGCAATQSVTLPAAATFVV